MLQTSNLPDSAPGFTLPGGQPGTIYVVGRQTKPRACAASDLIDRTAAQAIVASRQQQGTLDDEGRPIPVLTLAEFAESLYRTGVTPRVVSVQTLVRLLGGKMYPDLQDPETGRPVDWKALPRAARGRRNSRAVVPGTEERIAALEARIANLEAALSALVVAKTC